ncbi:GGDEF domain-containing protein [Altererythrobacter sp. BO-6]|uniref:GGDEF domain-containing protein n=1 Tax=Altererythrobacter sp. BO-6 TaxID=2604537 RepID=UPI0013E1768F|nr:GGDEF domain-containing protein [Altererythrobacter sp. BO-6]QIG54016.1 GGDEF domain-containing protein [Altererythrobacter sp. BO-6]
MSREPASHSFALREELDAALARRIGYHAWSADLKQALAHHQRRDEAVLLRFQLLIGLGISAMSLFWDIVAVPQKVDLAVGWRLLTIVPLTLIGLFVLRAQDAAKIKLVISLSLISMGMLAMHLASFGSTEIMARYSMATSFILALACLALPFTPQELARFALWYGLATVFAALWPHAMPASELSLYVVFTALLGVPAWAIARRHWNLRARAFLLDLRDDFNREELEKNNELLRQLSEQDPLTGMPNRRQFERVVTERMEALPAKRAASHNIAVMMIDLDHFKAFNDRHGHQAGDRCLMLAAAQLQAVFPHDYGVLARYGGEEFIAAMRERRPGQAAALAEEMRKAIAEMLVPVRDEAQPLITTSIGLALAPADSNLDLEDLIEMADVALYSAKRAGRNRLEIVIADGASEQGRARTGERRRA